STARCRPGPIAPPHSSRRRRRGGLHEDRGRRESDRSRPQGPQEAHAERGSVPGDEAPGPLREALGEAQAQAGPGAPEAAEGHAPPAAAGRRLRWGAPKWPPIPPKAARSAPAKPWHSSILPPDFPRIAPAKPALDSGSSGRAIDSAVNSSSLDSEELRGPAGPGGRR